jgi:SAM-dependent methyltransferase
MNLRDAWEGQAEAWAAWARMPDHDTFFWRFNLPEFLQIVPAPGRLTVDVGCGEGRVGRALAECGHRIVGVDASPTLVRFAATHESAPPVAVGDAAALPLRDGVADLAIAFMVLQDVDELEPAVEEIARVLAPNGCLCLAILHPISTAGVFVDDAEDAAFVIRRRYSDPARLVEPVERDGLTMVFNSEHRPLGAYFGVLERAGFVVEALREPMPDDALVRDAPRMERQRTVPWFLHLRARRNG